MTDLLLQKQYSLWQKNKNAPKISIPHIIHQIWIGNELPQKYNPLIKTLKNKNSNWVYKLWTEKDILSLNDFKAKDLFINTTNPGTKSDIARYEILRQFGGFYFDTDYECIQSLDPLADKSTFIICQQLKTSDGLGNSIIASVPHHIIIEELANNISKTIFNDIMEIINTTGPGYVTRIITENISKLKNTDAILPYDFFYPVPNNIEDIANEKDKYISKNSFAIHYWEKSWFPKKNIFFRLKIKIWKILKGKKEF